MPETKKVEIWGSVIVAALTMLVGMVGVWIQTNRAVEANQTVVANFEKAVKNSNDLRKDVIRPLEGRWDYTVDWELYFDVPSDSEDRSQQFFSSGIADIHWHSGFYQVLLGYENGNRTGEKYAVSLNTGTFEAPEQGLPDAGTRIEMSYAHRLGRDQVETAGQKVDYSQPPEDRYHYTIESFELDMEGGVTKINARFEIDMSKGKVTFSRIH